MTGHIFISAAHKSSGKTTVSIGLTAALQAKGLNPQCFKKGPDYIDPMWLGRASGRSCYNLDFYTMQQQEILDTFSNKMQGAGIGLIEGNKGLYDGLDLDGSNSNASLATLLGSPVVLVIDSRGMTRGIAPLVLGYQAFDENINIQGVILNQVGGSRHEGKLRAILEHYTDVQVIGAVHKNPKLNIDERHLGLIPSNEQGYADQKIKLIGDTINNEVDIDKLVTITNQAHMPDINSDNESFNNITTQPTVKIGILRDEAFGFYYPDDLEAFETHGAELVSIDSLHDKNLPDIDGLFIGGGFPEARMQALSNNKSLREAIRQAIESNLPVYAECGGLMYLARSINWNNESYDMVGAIQGDIKMHTKPRGRGYIQLQENNEHPWDHKRHKDIIFAHEFHYSEISNLDQEYTYAYKVLRGTGIDGQHDGIIYKNLLANYAHLRSTGNNRWVERFIASVRQHVKHAANKTLTNQR